jgi:hypothetical protein
MPSVLATRKYRDRKKAVFLETLKATLNIRASAEAAGVSRRTVYNWREDPEFNEDVNCALDDATDLLESEAVRRAKDGVLRVRSVRVTGDDGRTVFERVEQREYSDILLIFLLKSLRPERYNLPQYDLEGLIGRVMEAREKASPAT